eukprot:c145_g1_i2.p1 GENE.c145_g1_i2~~c145_g1_i2.p1  ORF type:complete len:209 (-),score=58.15 c145_g1_i2:27-653(-)
MISHSHADHLDELVVNHFHNTVQWVVPTGLERWFSEKGVNRVTALTWWDQLSIGSTENHSNVPQDIHVTCVPAQHHTQRGLFDKNKTLWCGYVLELASRKLFFSGDTGYCDVFHDIGKELGPFDVSLLPIGTYEPRQSMRAQHANPSDAVQIHNDLKSKLSIGMHWGTFCYSDEPILEPPNRLQAEMKTKGIPATDFICLRHGQTIEI